MAAPSKSWTDILDSKINVDSAVLEKVATWIRDNTPANFDADQAHHHHDGLSVNGWEEK